MTIAEASAHLDAGRLEMIRPQGDWVKITRRGADQLYTPVSDGEIVSIPVFMEREVEATITRTALKMGNSIRLAVAR